MTTTPRTDAEQCPASTGDADDYSPMMVSADFARQLERELAAKERELEEVKDQFRLVGDMAVVDWDDKVVGMVDKVPFIGDPNHPEIKTYAEKVRNLYKRSEYLAALQQVARELATSLTYWHGISRLDNTCDTCKVLTTYNNLPPEVKGTNK